MKSLENMERIAKLIRYNLVSIFYLILIIAVTLAIFNLDFLMRLTPLIQSMLNFS